MTVADVDECIEILRGCQFLSADTVAEVCSRVIDILLTESNVREIRAPVTVVGDIHGQLFDLLEIFKIGGDCPDTNYLFLGDYVDRGRFNVETISLLMCLKLRYPDRITLLRGNHESRGISQVYGFYKECMQKYGDAKVWNCFMEMFDCLNLGAIIENEIFAVHGGLSPSIHTVDQIRVINRLREPPGEGPFADLMWSDPGEKDGFNTSTRNAGYTFGADVTNHFLKLNGFSSMLRAHQLAMDGYQLWFDGKCATVWSAPNYCYRCGNVASILEVDDKLHWYFNVFSAAPEDERKMPSETVSEPPHYFL